MAVVRARSSPPYGAFVGFFLFGVATVAAVAIYFMYASRAEDISAANKAVSLAGSTSDVNDFKTANASSDQNTPALRQANQLLAKVKKELADATSERDSLKDQIAKNQNSIKASEGLSNDAQAAAQQSSKNLLAAREGFAKEVATLTDQINTLRADVAKANAGRDAAIAKGQEDVNKALADFDDKNREKVLQIEQYKSEIAVKDNEIRELRQRILNACGRQGVPSVGEPDGTIVRVNQATGEAYILLGKKDRIVPGLTFTAYDPRLGVRFGTDEVALGNGSVEVIEVGETTSLCRITRTTPNKAIQAGDFIANIVYHNDRTRLFRFVVRGDFDLDGDGVATAAERDRIVRLIVSWGGKVEDGVTSQTDYLVTGAKPASLASIEEAPAAGAAPSGPEPGSVADVRRKEQDDFEETIIQAKRLSIPVLNANRFLAMVGYYNTTIVRYGAGK